MSYERQLVTRLHAYVPGEQPQGGKVVKLNTNENPYPPAEAVMQAVHAVPAEMLRRYPSPTAEPFRRAAAKLHGVAPEQVIATNGGDELLRLAITTFVEPGRPIVAYCPICLGNLKKAGADACDLSSLLVEQI